MREAATLVGRALKVDPQNPAAVAFKRENDTSWRPGAVKCLTRRPSKRSYIAKDKTDAGTLTQDGKLFYEMGKFDEAEVKLKQAIKLDPDKRAPSIT